MSRPILGLLRPTFNDCDTLSLSDWQRIELARHFVRRMRRDIEHDWEREHGFPQQVASDESYRLSPAYRGLFRTTYDFCCELVETGRAVRSAVFIALRSRSTVRGPRAGWLQRVVLRRASARR